jgi:glycosyltransferase involved in cell wall biosynthesis
MRIGWISSSLPYLPARGGFGISGANLISRLSRRHSIDLISLLREGDAQHVPWIAKYCNSVFTIPVKRASFPRRMANFVSAYGLGKQLNCRSELEGAIRSGFDSYRWDVLHVEGGFVGGLVPTDLPIAKVLSVHDSEILRAQEMLKCDISFRTRLRYTARQYYEHRYERLVYPRFERCLLVAERDLAFNRRIVPKATFAMISYGIDLNYFQPLAVPKQKATLVFHGNLGYPPNIQAAIEFADKIFPLIRRNMPDASFHLVGASPAVEVQKLTSRPGIKLSADLPDLRSALCSAQIYVCALRYGSGIKNKILEAMAMHLPIVGYPESTAGIDCIPNQHLLVADNPEQFAAQVLDLFKRPERAREIAEAGWQLVRENYSWEARAKAHEDLYLQVIDERHSRTNGNRQVWKI